MQGFFLIPSLLELAVWISPFFVVILWFQVRKIKKQIKTIEAQMNLREGRVISAPQAVSSPPKVELEEERRVEDQTKPPSIPESLSPEAIKQMQADSARDCLDDFSETSAQRKSVRSQKQKTDARSKAKAKESWGIIQNAFGENLTGIFGAIAVVLGLTFLFAYAAFNFDAQVRFFMLIGVAGLFAAIDYFLQKKEIYRPLAHWIGSAGAAVFLLACFGASAIPGLQFVDDLNLALGLLCLGILANFLMAYFAGGQSFASLHVILSLIPLAMVHDATTFLIGAMVAVGGLIFSFRNLWERHLFVTILSFFLFSLFWWFQQDAHALVFQQKFIYICGVLSVGLVAALIHYKKDYMNPEGGRWHLLVHISNWLMMGVSLSFVSILGKYLFVSLFIGSIAAFLLAREGRRKGIIWVYRCDTLVAQALLILGLISLGKMDIDWNLRLGLVFLSSYLFAVIHQAVGENFIHKISLAISQISILVFCTSLLTRDFDPETAMATNAMITAPVILFAGLIFHLWTIKRFSEEAESTSAFFPEMTDLKASITGALLALIPAAAFFGFRNQEWAIDIFLVVFLVLYAIAYTIQAKGLGFGSLFGLALMFIAGWSQMAESYPGPWMEQIKLAAPLMLAGVATSFFPAYEYKAQKVRWPSIYLSAVHLVISLFIIFQPIMSIVTPLVLVLLTPIISEVVRSFDKKEHESWTLHLCYIGFAFFILFFGFYFYQTIQSEVLLGIVKARFVVELAGLAALVFWFVNLKGRQSLTDKGLGKLLQPLVLEAALLLLVAVVYAEVYRLYHPIFWIAFAFILFRLGFSFQFLSRLRIYSVLFMWASAIHLVAITSAIESPSLLWYLQPWFIGAVCYFGIGLYLYLYFSKLKMESVELVGLSGLLSSLKTGLAKRPIELLFYPVFITAALFLFWRLDSAVLTVAWVGLCFIIFVLGTQLRVASFLNISFVAVGLCMLRLVFYDLSKTGIFVRGLVFIGVGGLMLAMNFIYRRSKNQLETGS